MLKEFKEFALKGNMLDLAIGIIIGAAFGKIITSLVNDIIMPPIGLLLGNVNFSDLAIVLKEKTAEAAAVSIPAANHYGILFQPHPARDRAILEFLEDGASLPTV